MKFQEIKRLDKIESLVTIWGIVTEIGIIILFLSMLLLFEEKIPWGTRKAAVAVLYGFSLLCWGILLGASRLRKSAKREFSKTFFHFHQEEVDARLRELAGEFLAACQETPPSAQKIRALKEKFWHAHNLAGSLGFSVRPKVRDYAKEGR